MNTMASAKLINAFDQVSGIKATRRRRHKTKPFAVRLTADERAYLEAQAGEMPLGAYMREILLGGKAQKRRKTRKPELHDEQIAAVLARLGDTRLSSNMNQLAKHANMGALDVSRDIEQELQDACKAIYAMRDALMIALGMRPVIRKEAEG